MSFKISNPDATLETGRVIPKTDRSDDPFVKAAAKRARMAFMDETLTTRIEEKMKSDPRFKTLDAGFIKMLATGSARNVRACHDTLMNGGSSNEREAANEAKNNYPAEYQLVVRATQLVDAGKTNEEILETLKEEMDKSLLESA